MQICARASLFECTFYSWTRCPHYEGETREGDSRLRALKWSVPALVGCRGGRQVSDHRGTLLISKRPPPPWNHHRALGMDLLQGPTGRRFLVDEVPLDTDRTRELPVACSVDWTGLPDGQSRQKLPDFVAFSLSAQHKRQEVTVTQCRMRVEKGVYIFRGTSLIRKHPPPRTTTGP